jgi:CheY-like chemotaxis protein
MPVVIIADDEDDVALLLRAVFRLAGFEVYTANSANEYIQRIEAVGKEKVDIICMDGKLAADRV